MNSVILILLSLTLSRAAEMPPYLEFTSSSSGKNASLLKLEFTSSSGKNAALPRVNYLSGKNASLKVLTKLANANDKVNLLFVSTSSHTPLVEVHLKWSMP